MDPFLAEIRIFPFRFAPKGWAFCDGQSIPLSQNTALFSLLGVTYGGDGKSNFSLPNMQGRAPMLTNPTTGPNPRPPAPLSTHFLGEQAGVEQVTLQQTEMPLHSHAVLAAPNLIPANNQSPADNSFASSTQGKAYATAANLTPMSPQSLPSSGGSQPHNNMMPYITFNFNIALQGIYPQRG